jgi:hypothetical protein
MRHQLALGLAVLTVLAAGCANIPQETTAQGIANDQPVAPGPIPQPDPKAGPLELVRSFIGEAGNPEAAKAYLTDTAKKTWQGDAPPTIINENFNVAPIPVQERKAQGDDSQATETTVELTVNKVGQLDTDRAFTPAFGPAESQVVLRRQNAGEPWRIETPPPLMITSTDFNHAYKPVRLYFFDPDLRVLVPDLRYVPAEPFTGVPSRVMELLLQGPSGPLRGAVRTQIGDDAELRTNAVTDADGALVVNLTKLGDQTPDDRNLIAAQVVESLREVVQGKIRLLVDGHPLAPGHGDWRVADLPSYDEIKGNPEQPGLFTANGRVYTFDKAALVAGQAGNGELNVQSAAQSLDGGLLAVVQEVPTGVRLRIGALGAATLPDVGLQASTLTRPTWRPGSTPAQSNEVWTVQNNLDVVRMVRTGNDTWVRSSVDAFQLKTFGTITDLRLSRDGVRLAAVANGQVVVASIVRDKDSVTIQAPRLLQSGEVRDVVGVDWRNQDTVVAVTSQSGQPVLSMPVDGFNIDPYSRANLGTPKFVAAAPDREVVVTDHSGMWTVPDAAQVWRLTPVHQFADARAFYPG